MSFDHSEIDSMVEFEEVLAENFYDMVDRFRFAFDSLLEHRENFHERQGLLYQSVSDATSRGNLVEVDSQVSFFAQSRVVSEDAPTELTLIKNEVQNEMMNGQRGILITVIQMRPDGFVFKHESISYRDAFGVYDLMGGGHILDAESSKVKVLAQQDTGVVQIDGENYGDAIVNLGDLWSIIDAGNAGIGMLLDMQSSYKS